MSENIKKFETKVTVKQGFHVSSTIRTHSIEIDEPKTLGGTDKGANPVELVLAALGACQQIVLKTYAPKLGVEIKSIETTVEGELDISGFLGTSKARPGFQKINATTKLNAKGDPEKIRELLRIAEERCPVLDIVRNGVPVKATIQVE